MELNVTRMKAALELLRHKALIDLGKHDYVAISIADLNEVFIVAGMPVIVPEELKAKELDVISTDKEDQDNDTL